MESGNWTFISNRVVPPVSKLSVCMLVAPPFFAYAGGWQEVHSYVFV